MIFELPADERIVTIGRRTDNHLALEWDGEVSRVHAELERVAGEWAVVDDGLSRNGTFVNGERVTGRRRLRDGDRVVFGETPVLYGCRRRACTSRPPRCSWATRAAR